MHFGVGASPADLHLGVAVVRGPLIDVVATDGYDDASMALERFIDMWQLAHRGQSPPQPTPDRDEAFDARAGARAVVPRPPPAAWAAPGALDSTRRSSAAHRGGPAVVIINQGAGEQIMHGDSDPTNAGPRWWNSAGTARLRARPVSRPTPGHHI